MNAPIRFRDEANPDHTAFYVSAIDGERFARMAGPFASLEAAQAAVASTRAQAEEINSRAFWWAWGTCSMPEHDGFTCPLPRPA